MGEASLAMIEKCDDAEVVTIERGDKPKKVTFIYPYYENPIFLAKQFKVWSSYNWRGVAEHLSVIIVDDGSPKHPAREVKGFNALGVKNKKIRLFRIEVDVRWNWLAARNIGAHRAETDWIMLTDMDHVVPERVLRGLIYGAHDPNVIYRFSRVGTKTTPHPNSWFMTRDMFWKIGGYDESASGYYGTDGEYRRRCASTATIKILQEALVHHEYEDDSSTLEYKRKQPEDARGKQILRSRRGLPPKVLSFPYHEVTEFGSALQGHAT